MKVQDEIQTENLKEIEILQKENEKSAKK